jgi:Family of unknown function (DUF6350)
MGAMVDLLTTPLLRRTGRKTGARVSWLAAVGAAGWSAIAGLALLGLPVLLVWLGAGAAAPIAEPLRLAGLVWLAAHRVGVEVGGAWWQLAPWGLTLLPLLLLHRAGRWAAQGSGVATARSAVVLTGAIAAGYATAAAAVAGLVDVGGWEAVPAEAAVLASLVAAAGAGCGVAQEAGLLARAAARMPLTVRPAISAGVGAAAALVATGGLLVAFSAVRHTDRIGQIGAALDPGTLGAVVLALLGAALAPNAAVWAASYALGPGFAVGAETAVAPTGVEIGMVPALPALGALPASTGGLLGWCVMLGPLTAGAVAALLVDRVAPYGHWWRAVPHALGGAAVAALGMGALAGLSGGSVGTGRLVQVGPDQAWVALATFAEVGAVAVLLVLALRLRRR